ncbi:MAG: hypothetical protein PHG61_10720 [Candidatus Marinimicrobia bacterium]|nr:hypothetical protein [Candidatus Neomarinimicrobiota bacterium]
MKTLKKIRKSKKISCLLTGILLLFGALFVPLMAIPVHANPSTVTFRPFYSGYAKGTLIYSMGEIWNTTDDLGITREWNFESWNIASLTMTIRFCRASSDYATSFGLTMYISQDKGATFPESRSITVPAAYYGTEWTTGIYFADFIYTVSADDYDLFTPTTRLKFAVDTDGVYLAVVYWGAGQIPVPPYDYIDEGGNYIQYFVQFHCDYTEETIEYIGDTLNLTDYPITKEKLIDSAEMILDCMQPSGATDEFTDKLFGRDSYIVIYSAQLGFYELMDACALVDADTASHYLVAARRFLTWMWSKQNADGSFPFILTDGDQHPWYNATDDRWYGYDKIDSFSALAISCMWKYYNSTGDLDFINEYWDEIYDAKDFIVSLVNTTYWLPVDGWHYDNATGYTKSDFNWIHDSCEAYQGLIDFALLEDARGNGGEYAYWTAYAGNIASGIRTHFWNETLGRYAGMFFVTNGTQNTARVYGIITPTIYGIETNVTRGAMTLEEYLTWGTLSGRYYEVKYTEDYNIFNEYATMSGMVYSALTRLLVDFDYSTQFFKDKFLDVSEFLFCNPVYPALNLQNQNGFLDWTNQVNYTYAVAYARLIETSAWFMDGFLTIQNMTEYYTYSAAELAAMQESINDEESTWSALAETFESTYGFSWNKTDDAFDAWVNYLKNQGLYVEWYDWVFKKYLLEKEYLGTMPWWEQWTPQYGWWLFLVYGTTRGTYLLYLGIAGAVCMISSPCWFAFKLRQGIQYADEIIERGIYALFIFIIGFCLVACWLGAFA